MFKTRPFFSLYFWSKPLGQLQQLYIHELITHQQHINTPPPQPPRAHSPHTRSHITHISNRASHLEDLRIVHPHTSRHWVPPPPPERGMQAIGARKRANAAVPNWSVPRRRRTHQARRSGNRMIRIRCGKSCSQPGTKLRGSGPAPRGQRVNGSLKMFRE
jgi:hypothetical protein